MSDEQTIMNIFNGIKQHLYTLNDYGIFCFDVNYQIFCDMFKVFAIYIFKHMVFLFFDKKR